MEESFEFPVLDPQLQLSFYYRLKVIREEYLSLALQKTVKQIDLKVLDDELNQLVPSVALNKLASFGLRGELIFPVPTILFTNPLLLGYYRLLLGFSQKEFYSKGPFGKVKSLEDKGVISKQSVLLITPLCKSLITSGSALLDGLSEISTDLISDLQLLTIGPQLRGSANNKVGQVATQKTFEVIKSIVKPYIVSTTLSSIQIENDSGRIVNIEFAADPDIQIIEVLKSSKRGLISIEIKGGTDYSNIHNRIGEAEKSHQKAKKRGYFEFMTILRVDVDYTILRSESPTTSHFFHLDKITDKNTNEYEMFREILSSILSIKS
ncbi:MAG: XcyI family restriction endonuclease [Tunicatimonas sp.]